MSVPRGELFFLSFLVQQNAGDFSKVRKFFDEFVRGILSLSLSLSVFVVAFHQTHLIPVKDRQTDRRFVLSLSVCLSVSLSLTLCLVRLVSQDGNLMSPFSWERIETPLQLSNYWRRRPGKQTDRQTHVLSLSLSVCLVRLVSQEENLMSPFSKREMRPPPTQLSNNYWRRRRLGNLINRWRRREKRKTTTEQKNQTI